MSENFVTAEKSSIEIPPGIIPCSPTVILGLIFKCLFLVYLLDIDFITSILN